MSLNKRAILTAALAAALIAAATHSAAAQTSPAPAPQDNQQASINESDINAFAAAASEVKQLNQKWLPRMKAAQQQGGGEEQQVKQQALAEMTQALEKNGLSVGKYNEIYDLTQANPEVLRKVQERMQPTDELQDEDDSED